MPGERFHDASVSDLYRTIIGDVTELYRT